MIEKTTSFLNLNGLGNVAVPETVSGKAVPKAPLVQC